MEIDKILHFLAGFFVFQITFFISLGLGYDASYALCYGLIASIIAGALKEAYDFFHPNHYVELFDFIMTVIGGITGFLIVIFM